MRLASLVVASLAGLSLAACGGASRSGEPTAIVPSSEASISPRPRAKQLVPPWSSAAAQTPTALATSVAGQQVLEIAHRMVEEGTVVRGSCYRYIDTVFTEAGYDGWRRQTTVYRGRTRGPYADLDLIQPGDWLYIVNHPEASPVGTHSVIFVRWIDRTEGYAETVSYVGGGRERPGDRVGYDVTRTYRIQRAVQPD